MTDDAPWGVIDIGTHSVLLLVARPERDGTLTVLSERAEITRLGEGLDGSPLLGADAVDRTLRVMKAYQDECVSLGVHRIVAIGTSAMRRAANAEDLQNRAQDLLGIRIRIIDGIEEAARRAIREGWTAEEAGDRHSIPAELGEWTLFNPSYFRRAIEAWMRELS